MNTVREAYRFLVEVKGFHGVFFKSNMVGVPLSRAYAQAVKEELEAFLNLKVELSFKDYHVCYELSTLENPF